MRTETPLPPTKGGLARNHLSFNAAMRSGLRQPSNVLDILPATGKRTPDHPAQYPEDIPRFFIRLLTDPGDLVMDPFARAGGTTLAVALAEGRRALGIEKHAPYHAFLERRFRSYQTPLMPTCSPHPCDNAAVADAPAAPTGGLTTMDWKIGELFAGAGGMALGAARAGFRHVWANDIDPDACATFRRNLDIDPASVVCAPVAEFDPTALPPIDGLVFGFPCNDYSVVGERAGTDGRYGPLYKWGVRALQHCRPAFFVAENVDGLASTKLGEDLKAIMTELEDAGYETSRMTYRFEFYDVPQARHRIIIVGFRRGLNGYFFMHPAPANRPRRTCREALERPPIPAAAANHEMPRHPERVVERLRHIRPGENAFTADLPAHLRLQMRSKALISAVYRRLDPDRPAYTVTAAGRRRHPHVPLE